MLLVVTVYRARYAARPFLGVAAIINSMQPDNSYKAQTFDSGKPPLAMLPIAGIRAVANVQAYGNQKYKDWDDWRKGMESRRILSCALRHIYAHLDGETLDPESKQPHLAM